MNPYQQDVHEFNKAIGRDVAPAEPMLRTPSLQSNLVLEEALETACALVGPTMAKAIIEKLLLKLDQKRASGLLSERPSIVDAIDGIIDTIYVCMGTAEDIGVDLDPFWAEVQMSNMAKLHGPVDPATGKKLKPDGWRPPDINGVLGRLQMEASWKR